MDWNYEELSEATQLFMKLMSEKQLNKFKDEEYFDIYSKYKVKMILREVFEKQAKVNIILDDKEENIYVVPALDNELFSYSNKELREKLKLKDNKELYLSLFSIVVLLSEIFDHDDIADYIVLESLEKEMSNQIAKINELTEEEIELSSDENQLDLKSIKKVWEELPLIAENAKTISRTKGNRLSFLSNVIRFLEEEGFVEYIERQKHICPTYKLKTVFKGNFTNNNRKNQLLELINNEYKM